MLLITAIVLQKQACNLILRLKIYEDTFIIPFHIVCSYFHAPDAEVNCNTDHRYPQSLRYLTLDQNYWWIPELPLFQPPNICSIKASTFSV